MTSERVRPVIECLCQILSVYDFSTVTSESFRLAKFDRNEVTEAFWRLIFEMIQFDPSRTSQQTSKRAFDRTPKEQLVDTIKNDLYQRGYVYEQFLSLDAQMQQGSRQLLVCIGWLIYHLQFVEQCVEQCLKSMVKLDLIDSDHQARADPSTSDLIDRVKQALDSNSKSRLRLHYLHEEVLTKRSAAVDEPMTACEEELCQHPAIFSQYLVELENERDQLKLFLFWHRHEKIFWKWMESVLDQPSTSRESNPCAIDSDCQRLEAEKEKFHAALDTLDSALIRLEQLWISTSNHQSMRVDVASVLGSIDTQISFLFNQLLETKSASDKGFSSAQAQIISN